MFWWLTKKIIFWLWAGWVASYLQRSLSAQVNGGVQMPPHTSENSYFLRSGPQGATLVMHYFDLGFSRSNFEIAIFLEWEGPLWTLNCDLDLGLSRSYLRNGRVNWHGMKGMWVDRMLDQFVTLNFDLTHDLTLDFQGKIFTVAVSQEWEGWLTWTERGGMLDPLCDLELLTLPMTLTLDFQGLILK